MASIGNDEGDLEQCISKLIDTCSNVEKLAAKRVKGDTITIDGAIQSITDELKKYFSTASSECGNYLLYTLRKHNYDEENQIFSKKFTTNDTKIFLNDLTSELNLVRATHAAWAGDIQTVKKFIENHPNLKDRPGPFGTTILYSAARNNHMNLIKHLIEEANCSVNVRNNIYGNEKHQSLKATNGSTALHAACYHGHLAIVKYLIAHGADYFILNDLCETPIQNALRKSEVPRFFHDFLILSYLQNIKSTSTQTILKEIETRTDYTIDCVWEYKPFSNNRWLPFNTYELQSTLITSNNQYFHNEIDLKVSRQIYHFSMARFLRYDPKSSKTDNFAWIRCRGSSLQNFHIYANWQIMFMEHPRGESSSSPLEAKCIEDKLKAVSLETWYQVNEKTNLILETAMNYRRRYIVLDLNFFQKEKIKFDLENFTFTNQDNSIGGFLRWLPKIVSDIKNLKYHDNFKMPDKDNFELFTVSRFNEAKMKYSLSDEKIQFYELKYEDVFSNDNWDFIEKSEKEVDGNQSVNVIMGDLIDQDTDVIVVCLSSKYLIKSIMRASDGSLNSYIDREMQVSHPNNIISAAANGRLRSKQIYFVDWHPSSDNNTLRRSIDNLVTNVIRKADEDNYKSISFPAIGCGDYVCPVATVAQAFVSQVRKELLKYQINVTFVIHPDRQAVYDEFKNQIPSTSSEPEASKVAASKAASINIEKGTIEIEKGDITKQKVDVVVISQSSQTLFDNLISAAGKQIAETYNNENTSNPNALLISTPAGNLPCKRIFFVKWEPNQNLEMLRQSITDLMWTVVQNTLSHNYTSIAFPAIGCGKHECSTDTIINTMVKEVKSQMKQRKLPWHIKFVIQNDQQNIYDMFCKELSASTDDAFGFYDIELPKTWERSGDDEITFTVSTNTDEYASIVSNFDKTMNGCYKKIIQIQRIQNKRWYMQFMAHAFDFQKRLHKDTIEHLYHGCPENAAQSIIHDCFNRSFAGKNGTSYGIGVYFSSNASYSHGFTKPNSKQQRFMFVAAVLIGKTTPGNSSMKTAPVGYDSTTDGKHIFVTYHDAQAYAEYLIKYI